MVRFAAFLLSAAACIAASDDFAGWNPRSAASYLDGRAQWWSGWSNAARDHGTACVSCHTTLPYALARPALSSALGESAPPAPERKVLDDIVTRVRQWNEVEPFYDEKRGPGKSAESRATEAVLNAVILASYDSRQGSLGEDARLALRNMWAMQLKSGDQKGAWTWLNFHNAPWEYEQSQYWGATLAALAAGFEPKNDRPADQVNLLSEYLRRNATSTTVLGRVFLLYAASQLPGLLDSGAKDSILAEIRRMQQKDGGWSVSGMVGDWKRHDDTPFDTRSDGYATGLVALALERSGVRPDDAALNRALSWLRNNQDKNEGSWPAWSLNKNRDPASDVGRFMADSATAYAVLALTSR